ncbi:phytase [Chryseolinea sp. T2]|uniref:phytase n=1 Tax=Chryseolinea sp. T2 TaxID=3129255 RepID=UPI003076A239
MDVRKIVIMLMVLSAFACKNKSSEQIKENRDSVSVLRPAVVTDSVKYDTDDPAIWINPLDKSQSLIIGTDKGGDTGDGALYVFGLDGREIKEKTIHGIKRPNNVDVAYGLTIGKEMFDVAVCTERNTNSIRVFSLPDMKALDGGGLPVFENDTARLPMGIALYKHKEDIYAIVSRKSGPSGSYLHQYLLDGKSGKLKATQVRAFGEYSGMHEIEAVAVDNEAGYIYFSDEGAGIRKYYAHPDSSNRELAFFGTSGFADNHEGISIYKSDSLRGYIIVSDQQANQFHFFRREGSSANPHKHLSVGILKASTVESDGNEVTNVALPGYPQGFFIAMSDDKTFQIYPWIDVMKWMKLDD